MYGAKPPVIIPVITASGDAVQSNSLVNVITEFNGAYTSVSVALVAVHPLASLMVTV